LNTSQQAEDPEANPRNNEWMECNKDLERLEVTDWEERIQDYDYWRSVMVAAKSNRFIKVHKKKKKKFLYFVNNEIYF